LGVSGYVSALQSCSRADFCGRRDDYRLFEDYIPNMKNPIDPDPKPFSPPNEVPGTSPDEVSPDQGDTDFPGSIPDETPLETPVTDPN
jgi:hypothetical protein